MYIIICGPINDFSSKLCILDTVLFMLVWLFKPIIYPRYSIIHVKLPCKIQYLRIGTCEIKTISSVTVTYEGPREKQYIISEKITIIKEERRDTTCSKQNISFKPKSNLESK